ncbi:30S ribosomal protein S20 [Desulfotalea psychrophila]|uniref:Small ribosomal subunit protein bS20 n=1 Tax=Desulfotalea psychrophila (strain LSv54 / DSM 12343) TaxID=177439 RepID=RS20_DESPS|nr:30S ribosomal protein S20 [Desulfotalea psychrophila]Q6AMS8.1 RecName: Full=Small ribosomal subunit protein bS20; AltName: Full=30S ribosomal protein S20 [Desulfotalea psychrophila LSv54]CAG36347.1 probable 30S ribosomal protein S20 [Desulfotalea psychrophila LSv54]
MANHKSAEKRNRQNQVARLRNKSTRTAMKNSVRKLDEALEAGVEADTAEALRGAISRIAKTASKGVIHKKTASRKISRLTKRVNALVAA